MSSVVFKVPAFSGLFLQTGTFAELGLLFLRAFVWLFLRHCSAQQVTLATNCVYVMHSISYCVCDEYVLSNNNKW